MAELNKTVLGRLSGAVGDVIFRQRNGKNFVGTKPNSFIPGNDPASVARRAKFALSINLAKTVNALPQLKSVWKKKTPAGLTPYNYIIKINYPNIENQGLSDQITLVPDIGFDLSVSALSLSSSAVQVDIDPIGTQAGIDPAVEVSLQLFSILFFSNPLDNTVKDHSILSLVSASKVLSLDTALSFSKSLSNQQTQLFDKYQDHKGFFAILSLDTDGNAVHYSNTFAG